MKRYTYYELKKEIENGLDLNAVNYRGETIFHNYQNFHLLELGLENGFNINAIDIDGNTIFHYNKGYEKLPLAIMYGFNLNAVNHEGKTIFHSNEHEVYGFVKQNSIKNFIPKKVFKMALLYGFNPNTKTLLKENISRTYGLNTIFHNGYNSRLIPIAVLQGKFNLNLVNCDGNTIFHYRDQWVNTRQYLQFAIQNKLDMYIVNKHQYTVFHYGLEYLKCGIAYGFKINTTTDSLNTIFHTTRLSENVFKLIPQNFINRKNLNNQTILHHPFNNQFLKIAYEKGFDINSIDSFGNTIFHYSFIPEMLFFAIERGFKNINHRNNDREYIFETVPEYQTVYFELVEKYPNLKIEWNPLFSGNIDIFKMAIDKPNCNPNIVNIDNEFPLLYHDRKEFIELLLAHPKIDVNQKLSGTNASVIFFSDIDKLEILVNDPRLKFDGSLNEIHVLGEWYGSCETFFQHLENIYDEYNELTDDGYLENIEKDLFIEKLKCHPNWNTIFN